MTSAQPTVTGYLYPWDVVGDPKAAAEIAVSGVDRVALAASYHSVRAATPRHPGRRLVDAYDAALYVPVAGQAWAGAALVPRNAAEWTGTDNSFATAAADLRGEGLDVDAWTVLTHSTHLGRAQPGLCVRNAFGEVYTYALCPSHPEVRTYARTVVNQVLELGKPDGLILEAAGPLGFSHQNRHEKTDGADYSATVQKLLSLCFCAACRREYKGRGLEPEGLQGRVRDSIRHAQRESNRAVGPSATKETAPDGLDTSEFRELLASRWDAAAALLDGALAEARAYGTTRIVVDTDPDPWATGPFVPVQALESLVERAAPVLVLQNWGSPADGVLKLNAAREAASGRGTYGAYVLALPPKDASATQWARDWRQLLDAGYEELHIYHLGLASDARRVALTEALLALRES